MLSALRKEAAAPALLAILACLGPAEATVKDPARVRARSSLMAIIQAAATHADYDYAVTFAAGQPTCANDEAVESAVKAAVALRGPPIEYQRFCRPRLTLETSRYITSFHAHARAGANCTKFRTSLNAMLGGKAGNIPYRNQSRSMFSDVGIVEFENMVAAINNYFDTSKIKFLCVSGEYAVYIPNRGVRAF